MISADQLQQDRQLIIDWARRIIPIRAISPKSGGRGEKERADEICRILSEMGISNFTRYDVEDDTGTVRPNIVVRVGDRPRTLWVVAHIDTVPEGDLGLWTYPPFAATVEGDRIYGRGTNDNGHAVFLSLLLLQHARVGEMRYSLGIAFVSDEELGSTYGIQHLLKQGVFRKGDIIIVPDAGSESGLQIEVAEKSILWLKFTVKGKQWHASMPDNAVNALREASKLITELDRVLHEKFSASNTLFQPPVSTFEPTKHEKNVDNINTIPGTEVFYFDCRVLPVYDLDFVLDTVHDVVKEFEARSKARVTYEVIQKEQAPPPTPENSEVVKLLREAIRKRLGGEPAVIGIGGGTCAAFFRKEGMDAAVWGTEVPTTAHRPDEYVVIGHILQDRDVIEEILYGR